MFVLQAMQEAKNVLRTHMSTSITATVGKFVLWAWLEANTFSRRHTSKGITATVGRFVSEANKVLRRHISKGIGMQYRFENVIVNVDFFSLFRRKQSSGMQTY